MATVRFNGNLQSGVIGSVSDSHGLHFVIHFFFIGVNTGVQNNGPYANLVLL